ncbi:MAG: hypothetical protein WBA07_07050 [Rivularia sp. (in: cyanobacteria)]
MNCSEDKYRIWLELDEYNIELDKSFDEEYCNAIISFSNGVDIGLNIWSEKHFQKNINNLDWIDEEFAILPDIIVKNYQASSIKEAIIDLIEK